jgi:hypothetical protein
MWMKWRSGGKKEQRPTTIKTVFKAVRVMRKINSMAKLRHSKI